MQPSPCLWRPDLRQRRHPLAVALALLALGASEGCGASAPPVSPPPAAPAGQNGARPPGAPAAPPRAGSTGPGGATAHPGTPAPAHPVPASFRIAAGAPSDAEVARDVAQMDRLQHAQQQALSAAAGNITQLLPWANEPKQGVHVSVASVFRDYNLGIACGGVLGVHQLGVAHKTAPCGTLVTFRYAGRILRVPVIDRGPYIAGREWDLTGAAADALGFPGLGQIEWSLGGLSGAPVRPVPGTQRPLGEQPGTPQTLPNGGR